MKEYCIDSFDAMNCNGAINFCESELSAGFIATGGLSFDSYRRLSDKYREEYI